MTPVYYLMFLFLAGGAQSYWWTVRNTDVTVMSTHSILGSVKFSKKQRLLLGSSRQLLKAVSNGATMAILECKRQFFHNRWNCSDQSSVSVFGKILNKACRETSFIHAITSAGATYALTKDCAGGLIKDCHCPTGVGRRTRSNNNWVIEGCHDNIKYGYVKGKSFTDATETSQDFKAILNLHNNEAGRLAVIDLMTQQCKCHGVSGNCNVKTCRRTLPPFENIGNRLRDKYDTAIKVQAVQVAGSWVSVENRKIGDSDAEKGNLIYVEESPDFCQKNLLTGSLGIRGRYCNASLRAKDSGGCELLCCGRTWKTEKLTRNESCMCIFKWCCTVECQTCQVTREYSYCL